MLGPVTDDDVSDEAEALPKNPALREVVPATPSDRTAMIDLEALEAKRAARRAEEQARADEEAAEDERTPPPDRPLGRDPEATGTMARGRGRSSRVQAPRAGHDAHGDGGRGEDQDEGDSVESTLREHTRGGMTRSGMARRDGTRTGITRAGMTGAGQTGAGGAGAGMTGADQPARDGTRTGMTRLAATGRKKALSPLAAAAAVVIGVVVMIAFVFVASRATGVLTVTTVPHGAAVTLDGEPIGTSPLQKRVRTGAHTIELTLEGYEPFREVVDVPSSGWPFLQPLKALPPPPPPPPTNAEIAAELAAQAKRMFDAGDLEGALAKVVEIERLVPDHAPSAALRAAVHEAEDKRQQALRKDAASAAFQAQLARARQKSDEGRRLYDQGKLGPARTVLYESLKIDPKNPDPHRTLAKIFNRDNDVDKVRYHLERFIELGGNDADFKVREWLKSHQK
jgi:hypothetical protein